MINQVEIKNLIDITAYKYQKCWEVLCLLKHYKLSDESGQKILEFQTVLGLALLNLEQKYREIHQEKLKIIHRKSQLSASWFSKRLKVLSDYQKAIMQVIAIGKSMGDAYAWYFYQNERDYLLEHLKHKPIFHMPPRIGSIGEIEFIKQVKVIEGCVTIYHSITNFLRIEDVSFIDLKTLNLVAIGEIKTKIINEKTIRVFLALIDSRKDKKFNFLHNAKEGNSISFDFPNGMESRLNQQIKFMIASFKSLSEIKPTYKTDIFGKTYTEELKTISKNLKSSKFLYQKAGNGLLIVAYKNHKMRLSSKILSSSKLNMSEKLDGIIKHTMQIIDKSSEENSVILGSLHYGRDSKTHTLIGMIPIFWWPIDLNFLKKFISKKY